MQLLHHGFACNTDAGFSLAFAHGNLEDTTTFKTVDRNELVAPAVVRDDSNDEYESGGGLVVPTLESMMAAESPNEFAGLEAEDNPILENLPNHCLITPGTFEEVGGAKVVSAKDLAFAIIEAFQNAAADDDEISTEREAEAAGLEDTLAMLWASEQGLLKEIHLVDVPESSMMSHLIRGVKSKLSGDRGPLLAGPANAGNIVAGDGNNTSMEMMAASSQSMERVGELLAKDVTHGFTIPLPIAVVELIPGAMVQPLGLVQQLTVDLDGKRKAKFRLTQDLSFSTDRKGKPTAINARVDMAAYAEMVYGWCLPRIIHFIVALRLQNPTLLILISKYDYSDAYRRIAHSATAAAQTIAINGATAFLSLRLTFGGSPNPLTWCMFSELVTDLANEIGQCNKWDPAECRSPAQPMTPDPLRLPASVPIAQARRMAVHIPPTKAGGRVDRFIDDLINVFLDTPANCQRHPNIVPLAMHLTSRPHAGDNAEPIPHRPILSIPKLIAEGRPEEVQIVLGWRLNTRLLEVSLPDDKNRAWSADVRKLREAGNCLRKELETLVGRLNHTAYIIPNARHSMSRIRRGLEA